MKQKYWFKPRRFWHWFAAYYPSSWQGWLVSIISIILLAYMFRRIDSQSHSVSDTLIGFSGWVVLWLFIMDVLTRIKGEYPSWWRKRNHA